MGVNDAPACVLKIQCFYASIWVQMLGVCLRLLPSVDGFALLGLPRLGYCYADFASLMLQKKSSAWGTAPEARSWANLWF